MEPISIYFWRQQNSNLLLVVFLTRLALQLLLVEIFTLLSFQLQDFYKTCIVIYCHYLPALGLGNLRACCLP